MINPGQSTGNNNIFNDIQCAGAHTSCSVVEILADVLYTGNGIQDDGEDTTERNHEDGWTIAQTKPDNGKRNPGP